MENNKRSQLLSICGTRTGISLFDAQSTPRKCVLPSRRLRGSAAQKEGRLRRKARTEREEAEQVGGGVEGERGQGRR